MRGKLKHLPKPVVRTLLAFYLRTRFYELLRGLLAPLLCYAVLALLATHLDRFLFLETPQRQLISILTHGFSLATGLVTLGLFVWRQRSVSRLAYELESRLPKSAAERLVTLDDVLAREAGAPGKADGSAHAAMLAQLTNETVALCQQTPHVGRLARDRRLKRRFGLLALLALGWAGLLAVPAYQFPLMLERLTFPGRNLPKPSFMKLKVTPEAAVVGRGGEVVLQVQVAGSIPPLLQRPMQWFGVDPSRCLLATATGQVTRLAMGPEARPMSRVQSRLFVASRSDLQESFSYRVRCGDAQTDIRLVRVVPQPRVINVHVMVDSPAYTGLKTARFDDLRDAIPVFLGSRVKVSFASDQSPLKSASLVNLRDGNTLATLKPDPKTGTYLYEFAMEAPLEMEVVLVNEQKFENVERVNIALVVRDDQSPTVRLEYPGGEITCVQGELVPMQMEAADDLGLLEGAICYQVSANRNAEASTREILLPIEENKLAQSLAATLDLAKVDAVPGDDVLMWVRVRDTGRNDARSQTVRIRISAFSGNDNERRRLAALRLIGQILTTAEPSADRRSLALNDTACEPLARSATGMGLALRSPVDPQSLLNFLECEHFFTDSADAAGELLYLYGVMACQFTPPAGFAASVENRRLALRRLADETLPALVHERMGRDLIRRAFNLRAELLTTTREDHAAERKNRAAWDRRMDLLMEALSSTGDDLAALARLSPQLLKVDAVLVFNRQISLTGRELKQTDSARQEMAGKILCEQIDGWIGLLLQPIPAWKTQRLAARAALRAQFADTLQLMREGMQKAGAQAPPAAITGWMAAHARMTERSPFAGLGDRLNAIFAAGSGVQTALSCEAAVLARMAIKNDFSEWLASVRTTKPERRLALSLQALDLADDPAARSAAAEALRLLAEEAGDAGDPNRDIQAAPPAFQGLYAQLPALTDAVAARSESYEKGIEALGSRVNNLQEWLAKISAAASGEGPQNLSGAISTIESGLRQWEAEVQRLIYRMHLDLTYGDPRREEIARLVKALPALRGVLDQYQAVVPPLLNRLTGRLQRSATVENLSAVEVDGKDLEIRVKALGNKLKLAVKQMRGEAGEKERENDAVREMRIYYQAARQLAETNNPAAVAAAFFARNPAAAALVLDSRMALLRDLRQQVQVAGEALRTQSATSTVYRSAMQQAVRCASGFEQQAIRFAALDAEGVVRAKASDVRKRAEALIQPGRDTSPASLPRDRLALDELQRLAAQFENQAGEVIARYRISTPRGWRGGPTDAWDETSRRDAEHTRRRILAQYESARREIILGLDAALSEPGQDITARSDEPLASALFAWRTLHSSLGNGASVVIPEPPLPPKDELLTKWLLQQLEDTKKVLRQNEAGGVRTPHTEPTTRWVESMGGVLRY